MTFSLEQALDLARFIKMFDLRARYERPDVNEALALIDKGIENSQGTWQTGEEARAVLAMSLLPDKNEIPAIEAARNLQQAKQAYDDSVRDYFVSLGEFSWEEPTFWGLLEKYTAAVRDHQATGAPEDSAIHAASELCRMALASENSESTFEDVVKFDNTYSALQQTIHEALEEIDTDRSDDRLSDLCENLPLAGRDIITRVLQGGFEDGEALESAVRRAVGDKFAHFILEGENFLGLWLYKTIVRKYAEHLRNRKLLKQCDLRLYG